MEIWATFATSRRRRYGGRRRVPMAHRRRSGVCQIGRCGLLKFCALPVLVVEPVLPTILAVSSLRSLTSRRDG